MIWQNGMYMGQGTKRWHLVDKNDRDWKHGLTPSEKKRFGRKAKEVYLQSRKV